MFGVKPQPLWQSGGCNQIHVPCYFIHHHLILIDIFSLTGQVGQGMGSTQGESSFTTLLHSHNFIFFKKQAKYHPEMDSPEEETVRKAQFAKAHKMIQEHNSDPEATHHLTHNHFSSMVCTLQAIHSIIQVTYYNFVS